MTRRLQETDFDRSVYERPNRDWICGHTGEPCALGPDASGACTTTHECVPAREADRWRCTRTAPFGGECEQGPLPDGSCCNPVTACQPQRSIRARRGRTIRLATAVTLGVLAVSLAGDGALDFVYPGPVTMHHGTLEHECRQCHVAGEGGLAHWIAMALPSDPTASDSDRCLDCHDLGESNTLPHSVSAARLAATTARLNQNESQSDAPLRVTLASLGPARSVVAGAELACSVCHQEHRGIDHDLTAQSNDQCQVCHTVQFDRFEKDHPALGLYPHGRRPRILFDHATHIEDYFPTDEEEAISCVDCHAPEATGRTMDVNDFAVSCGDCHDADVRKSGGSGIAFLNLPTLDAQGLRRSGFDPGQWPTVDRGRAPSPFLALLLAADPRLASDDTAVLGTAAGRASRISELGREDRMRVGRWVWATKSLLLDLMKDGHRAVTRRLGSGAVASGTLSEEQRTHLVNGLDRTLVERAISTWFPDLEREVAIFEAITVGLEDLSQMNSRHWTRLGDALRARAGERRGRSRASSGDADGGERWVSQGGWYWSGRDAAIRYRSSGHADPFLRSWFDLASGVTTTGNNPSRSAGLALFEALRSEDTTGACSKCHSADDTQINWQPHRPDPTRKRATEFRHVPHFSLDANGTCSSCHRLREADADLFAEAYEPDAPVEGHALNFEPIGRDLCGQCHTREAAGDDCVACHNYHLGETTPIHLTSTMRAGTSDDPGDESDEE